MGLFSRKPEAPQPTAGYSRLGSGRRLSSSRSVPDCLEVLTAVVSSYRPERQGMPPLRPATCVWRVPNGSEPTAAVSCEDDRQDFLLASFTKAPGGTEIGLFPLGSGDQRLVLPIVGHWKQHDSSLSSIGTYPALTALLGVPTAPEDLAQSTLSMAGLPLTWENINEANEKIFEMILIKSWEFIESQESSTVATRHLEAVKRTAERLPPPAAIQSALDALAAWNSGVIPYIQDLPWRCRAILLEAAEVGGWPTASGRS